jgi:hypothetical protein
VVLPSLSDVPGADQPIPLPQAVARYARETAWVPHLLAGRTMDDVGPTRFDRDLLGDDPQAAVGRHSAEACAAARDVSDPDAVVHGPEGDVPAARYLRRLTVERCFLAHDIAIHLGSRACPLTEELARGLCELTQAEAASWRARGIFRESLPLPADVSWRDRFLLCAGRDPHPLDELHHC